MEDKKYLPIGTIVFMKNEIILYMIVGYINKSSDGNIKDYICIPFPYGFMSNKILSYFNHSDIEKIVFKGYINDKYKELDKILNENYNIKDV